MKYKMVVDLFLERIFDMDAPSQIKGNESMSENERKCLLLGLLILKLPFFCPPLSAFEQWVGFVLSQLFW